MRLCRFRTFGYAVTMTAKAKSTHDQPVEDDGGRFWQPPERRRQISDAGRKWMDENAEAMQAWNAWVEKNGLPLAKYRPL